MVDNIFSLGAKSESVELVNSLQKSSNQGLMAVHQYLLDHDVEDFNAALQAIERTREDLVLYLATEEKHHNKGNIKEIRLLQGLQKILNKAAKRIQTIHWDKDNTQTLTDLGYDIYTIQEKIDEINKFHYREMTELTSLTNQRMHQIIILYVLFSAVGILASFLGFSLLVRRLLDPINELNIVTEKVSQGDYTIRLHTDKDNEIGRLYKSFNCMTDKL